jgi:bifunctional DNA-binding transcriptional regulator/antitoxin component of YhaV-PrlF toxin-antitoxin module
MINTFITMTSKGTFTLPAAVRKQLGLTKAGDKLQLTFHEQSKAVELRSIPDLKAMQARNAAYIKNRGIKAITDDELRRVRQEAWGQSWERVSKQND